MENPADRRRLTRHDLTVPVRIDAGGRGIETETLNISGGGMALKLESTMLGGGKVKVMIGELGEFEADVLALDGGGRLKLDISEEAQLKLADEIVKKYAHMLPV
jgi:hypothetical protein